MSWKMSLARILSIGRKGESTKEMMGRPLQKSFFRFARMYPDGSWRPVRTQWRMVHLVIVPKWMDLERYFRWIGSRDMDSRYGVKRHVCPHSGRWRHQMWIEVG